MPLYDYHCEGGHSFERLVPLASFDDEQRCACGETAARMISAPMVISDCMRPTWGMDGKMHDSRKAWERSTNKDGDRFYPLAPGEGIQKAPEYKTDQKKLRDDIRAGIADVKNGRVPPVAVLGD